MKYSHLILIVLMIIGISILEGGANNLIKIIGLMILILGLGFAGYQDNQRKT